MAAATSKPPSSVQHTFTTTVSVPQDWIDYVTKYPDVFGRPYACGYWAYGAEHTHRGWLVYEQASEDRRPTEKETKKALTLFRRVETLPKHWHAFDLALALKAYEAGYARFGADWYETGDGPRYDWAIQMALFGEARYG